MKVIDRRSLTINTGDIVVIDDRKYLVVFEKSCIAWHFINLDTMEFDVEICTDLAPKFGEKIDGLGFITDIIKEQSVTMIVED